MPSLTVEAIFLKKTLSSENNMVERVTRAGTEMSGGAKDGDESALQRYLTSK